jgi:hypothetical protein
MLRMGAVVVAGVVAVLSSLLEVADSGMVEVVLVLLLLLVMLRIGTTAAISVLEQYSGGQDSCARSGFGLLLLLLALTKLLIALVLEPSIALTDLTAWPLSH